MRRFDSRALFHAIDQRRREQDLSWSMVARQIGISVSTLQRLQAGGRLEVDGMLAMVGWLGTAVETFVREFPA